MTKEEFQRRLTEEMTRAHMTDQGVADLILTARGTVARWRRGVTAPAEKLRAAIITALEHALVRP